MPEPRSGDDYLHRRLVGDVPVRVRGASRYMDVVAGIHVTPVQAAIALGQHLLSAREDEEVLGIVVAVQRDRNTGRYHAPHDAEIGAGIIWSADEFEGRSKHIHRRVRSSVDDLGQHSAVEFVSHSCLRFRLFYGWSALKNISN
jgi:hypothetical protein